MPVRHGGLCDVGTAMAGDAEPRMPGDVRCGGAGGKLGAQMEQLAAGAKCRERQIGTMTHDIRNPLATLVGLVTLLEEDELSEKETTHLLARVGSTSRAMDLLVKNVLDMYLLEEDNLQPHPRVIDPNVIVQEVADVYGREARLKGLRMRTELGGMPRGSLDPLH